MEDAKQELKKSNWQHILSKTVILTASVVSKSESLQT